MKALILVDIQNDFLPTGALPVPDGDKVVEVANLLMPQFECVVATQDWHPPEHGSFAANHSGAKPGELIELDGLKQILWPVHCVQNTGGAAFAPGLQTDLIERTFPKGVDTNVDSYSGFFDNGRRNETGMAAYLKKRGVSSVYVLGLATDYCVKFTALDAVTCGFDTFLVEDGCRGVNIQPGDVSSSVNEMRAAGVQIITSSGMLQ